MGSCVPGSLKSGYRRLRYTHHDLVTRLERFATYYGCIGYHTRKRAGNGKAQYLVEERFELGTLFEEVSLVNDISAYSW